MENFIIVLVVLFLLYILGKVWENISRNTARRKAKKNLKNLPDFLAHSYFNSQYGDVIAFNFMSKEVAIVTTGSDGYSRIIPMRNAVDPHLTKYGDVFSVYMNHGSGDLFGFGEIDLSYYDELKEQIDRLRALK